MDLDMDLDTANNYYNNKNYLESIKIYTLLIDSNPNDFRYYTNRSLAYFKLDDYKMCLKDCIKTIKLNPLYGKGWGRLGATLYELSKYNEAICAYKKAQELEENIININMIIHIQNWIQIEELKSDPKLLSELFSITMNNMPTITKLMNKDYQEKLINNPNAILEDNEMMKLMNNFNDKLGITDKFNYFQ
jgi:tetratricopeptide (TPR) repeat protein